MLLLCLPAIHGCAGGGSVDPVGFGAVLKQIDGVNQVRCPELAPADVRTLQSRTARPSQWPQTGATKGQLLAHVDKLELSEARKSAAASRVIAEHGRCRGASSPTS